MCHRLGLHLLSSLRSLASELERLVPYTLLQLMAHAAEQHYEVHGNITRALQVWEGGPEPGSQTCQCSDEKLS